jgi:transposase-like protein
MGHGRRDVGRERLWRERVARWRASGLSVREFCGRHGLTEPTFYYWKRELRVRDEAAAAPSTISALSGAASLSATSSWSAASKSSGAAAERVGLRFVPVTVLPSATVAVEVRCPSGHVVCLSAWDVAALAALFAALPPSALHPPALHPPAVPAPTREAPAC